MNIAAIPSRPTGPPAIRTQDSPTCYLCHSLGVALYEKLTDQLFGAPGVWTVKRCDNPDCSLIWLDPMPMEEDMEIAYETYYTHSDTIEQPVIPLKWILDSYRKYVLPVFSSINPVARERKKLELMGLIEEKPGTLLDVGCGDGARLAKLRDRGWAAYGQEIDQRAAAVAHTRYHLDVRLGPLEHAGFAEQFFDLIIMNHVIEHVHDPIAFLALCRRFLKPNGRLILTTPNSKSTGHKWFGPNWRGLEPPRHIFIFSMDTLAIVALRAGFTIRRCWSTSANANTFSNESLRLIHQGSSSVGFRIFQTVYRTIYQYSSSFTKVFDPAVGEECVFDLQKG